VRLFVLECIFASWFCATVVKQFSSAFLLQLLRHDLGLIPSWTFFAPNPGRSDVRLVYRDRSNDGISSPWQESCQKPIRTRWRILWNPEKVKEKALVDLTALLSQSQKQCREQPEMIMLMWPYLVLLDKSLSEPRSPGNSIRQFAILSTEGAEPPRSIEALFVSNWHEFDDLITE
jgi:hypothetical protein